MSQGLRLRDAELSVREMIRPVADARVDPAAAAKERERKSAERNQQGIAGLLGSLSGVK
jgi:hypothetical protein